MLCFVFFFVSSISGAGLQASMMLATCLMLLALKAQISTDATTLSRAFRASAIVCICFPDRTFCHQCSSVDRGASFTQPLWREPDNLQISSSRRGFLASPRVEHLGETQILFQSDCHRASTFRRSSSKARATRPSMEV